MQQVSLSTSPSRKLLALHTHTQIYIDIYVISFPAFDFLYLEKEPPIRFLFQALIAATSDSNIPTKITTNPSPSRNNKQEEEEEEEEEERDLSLEAEDLQKRKKRNTAEPEKRTKYIQKKTREVRKEKKKYQRIVLILLRSA